MSLKLNGSSSGYVALEAPAAAGSNTLTLPTSSGSANQVIKNGSTPGILEFGDAGVGGATGVDFNDGVKARWGTGNDLEIYHTGSDYSYIKDNSGRAYIRSNRFYFQNNAGDENMIYAEQNGAVHLYHDNTSRLYTDGNGVMFQGRATPHTDDQDDLGGGSNRWDDVWATNTTIITSDRNAKDNITTSDLGLTFVNKLTPVSFKFKGKTRTHYGFVAQDVETVLTDIGKSTTQFAGYIKSENKDENNNITSTTYGLRVGEFISPLVKAVQELSAEVETLKTKVAALEAA
jgi:hypothetical protein